jgi:four helix bundle protein
MNLVRWLNHPLLHCEIHGIIRAQETCMGTTATMANQLEKRLIRFAASIVSLTSKLPRTIQGRHVCAQILRSGTAVAANYGEARGAESRADFIHKLKVVHKELNETTIWLEVIAESRLLTVADITGIVAENRELCRIIAASIRTVRAGQQ